MSQDDKGKIYQMPTPEQALTNAGKLVLRDAFNRGLSDRIKEFEQYPDVVRALMKDAIEQEDSNLANMIRIQFRQLL